MKSNLIQLTKEGFWVLLGYAASIVGALVGVKVLTGIMSPSAYGELALAMTAATLVNQVVLGPISNGAMRFYSVARDANDLPSYFAAVKDLTYSGTKAVCFVAFFLLTFVIVEGRSSWGGLGFVALIFALISGYNGILDGIQNAARSRAVVALHQAAGAWGRFAVAAGLMLSLAATSTIAMLGNTLAMVVVLFSQVGFSRRLGNDAHAGNEQNSGGVQIWRGRIWEFSWPFATWGVLTWVQTASDRWALGMFTSINDVGLYAVLYQLGYYPISVCVNLLSQLLAPVLFERNGAKNIDASVKTLSRVVSLTLLLTACAYLATTMWHEPLFKVLTGENFMRASWLLPWMVLSGGMFAAGQCIALDMMRDFKTKDMIFPKIATALIGISFNLGGAYFSGLPGVVAASVAFSLVYLCWMAACGYRRLA